MINAGGVINVGMEYLGAYNREIVFQQTEKIFDTCTKIFEKSDRENIPAQQAAIETAKARIEAYKKKEITEERLAHSVKKILMANKGETNFDDLYDITIKFINYCGAYLKKLTYDSVIGKKFKKIKMKISLIESKPLTVILETADRS